jgi:ankyrin repeat protein/L-ascorbate metabolism protein UlaG (beta-lactamase superfamily)
MKNIVILMLFLFILFFSCHLAGEEIHEAAQKGDIEAIKKILEKQPGHINTLDKEGESPLHYSIWQGHFELAKFLIRKIEHVDIKNNDRQTPLHYAAYKKDTGIARLLLSKGADCKTRDKYARIPLHYAARQGAKDIVQLLIHKGSDINATDDFNSTPLILAFLRKQFETARMLIENNADVNIPDRFSTTILHICAREGNTEFAKYIIKKNTDLDVKRYGDETALHIAAKYNNIGVVKLLLENRANRHAVDIGGNTPLHGTAYFGRKEIARLLATGGADINKKNKFGITPLHQAAIAGYPSIVDLLINKGAKIDTRDLDGNTPISSALKYGNKKIADLIQTRMQKTSKGKNIDKGIDTLFKMNKNIPGKEGEAVVWYLGNSGWAIKTKTKLLIFDYWGMGEMPDEPSLANGRINPSEINGLDTYVFVSHSHFDHYNQSILEWEKSIKNITYIFGWQAFKDSAHECFVGDREKREINGIRVTNIRCDDGGSAFLVEVDGMVLYHSGDYSGDYQEDMAFLSDGHKKIDLAFIESGSVYWHICWHTIMKLKPEMMFPMHAIGTEYEYTIFAEQSKKKFPKTMFKCAAHRGDRYYYKKLLSN